VRKVYTIMHNIIIITIIVTYKKHCTGRSKCQECSLCLGSELFAVVETSVTKFREC
jgi:hypothetical protein